MKRKPISALRTLRTFMITKHHYVLDIINVRNGWVNVEMCDENGRLWEDSFNRNALKQMRRKNRTMFKTIHESW